MIMSFTAWTPLWSFHCMETLMELSLYGNPYGAFTAWKPLWKFHCMETLMELSLHGNPYGSFTAWKPLWSFHCMDTLWLQGSVFNILTQKLEISPQLNIIFSLLKNYFALSKHCFNKYFGIHLPQVLARDYALTYCQCIVSISPKHIQIDYIHFTYITLVS